MVVSIDERIDGLCRSELFDFHKQRRAFIREPSGERHQEKFQEWNIWGLIIPTLEWNYTCNRQEITSMRAFDMLSISTTISGWSSLASFQSATTTIWRLFWFSPERSGYQLQPSRIHSPDKSPTFRFLHY